MTHEKIDELRDLKERMRAFAAARDWEQFHTPRNLATAVAVEAAELLEPFRWATSEVTTFEPAQLEALKQEAADVLLCLVRFADTLGIELYQAALDKIVINESRYPADKVRGSAKKYSEY